MRRLRLFLCCLALSSFSFSLAEGSKTLQALSNQTANQEKPKDTKDEKADGDKKDKDEQSASEERQGSTTAEEDKADKKNQKEEDGTSGTSEEETKQDKDKQDKSEPNDKDTKEKDPKDEEPKAGKAEDKPDKRSEDEPADEQQAEKDKQDKAAPQDEDGVASPKKKDDVTSPPETVGEDKQKKEKSNKNSAEESVAPGLNKDKVKDAVKAVPGSPEDLPSGRSGAAPGQASSPRVYVGEVSVNDGENVFVGGSKLEGSSPWLSVVRQGMWVEAEGHWQDEEFVTEGVSVVSPNDWTYFRGPAQALGSEVSGAGYEVVEAWTANGNSAPEGVRALPVKDVSVRLVAFFDGTHLVAAPANLPPPPGGLERGWVELSGYFDGEKVVWEKGIPFP